MERFFGNIGGKLKKFAFVVTIIGIVASIIAGSSDTIFYIATIYFSKTNIKKLGLAIPIALFCTFLSAVMASWVCRLF